MKLNKVEKIVVAVIILGVILVAGVIMFVMPSFDKIGAAQKTLDANKKEEAEITDTLSRLDTIDADIDSLRKDAIKLEGAFYPDLTTYEASEIAMAYLEACNLDTNGIKISDMSSYKLNLEAYFPVEVEYDLKNYSRKANENPEEVVSGTFKDGGKTYTVYADSITSVHIADENGNEIEKNKYSDTMKAAYKRTLCEYAMSGKSEQVIGVTSVTYDVTGKYGDYLKFIDYINDVDRATYINNLTIPMTIEINEKKDSEAVFIGEDGAIRQGSEANGKEVVCDDNTVIEEVEVELLLFSVEPMKELTTITAGNKEIVVNQ